MFGSGQVLLDKWQLASQVFAAGAGGGRESGLVSLGPGSPL